MKPCAHAVLYVLEAIHMHSCNFIHNLAFLCQVQMSIVISYVSQCYTQA